MLKLGNLGRLGWELGTLPPFWPLPQATNSPPHSGSFKAPPQSKPRVSLALQDAVLTASHSPSWP